MEANSLPKIIMEYKPKEKRCLGRPKKSQGD
jgi:hypothetical protein